MSDFLAFTSKIATMLRYNVLLSTAQATKLVLVLVQMKMLAFMLLQFYDAAKTAKKFFSQASRALGMKQFYKQGS